MSSSSLRQVCELKQKDRQAQIDALPARYSAPLTPAEEKLHALPLAQLVAACKAGALAPADILNAYGKKTLGAHRLTNCITDFMFDEALEGSKSAFADYAESDGSDEGSSTGPVRECPLLGVPVSLKDTINIASRPSTIGLARHTHPVPTSSPLVHLLTSAGALLHCKTTVPSGLIAIETHSALFGTTVNPYNPNHSVGASTGGGGALVACRGSMVEVATDLAGSARIPAHFCGVWGLKGSVGRFPTRGTGTSLGGLEAVQIVAAPMAGSLEDLEEFWKRVVGMRPWDYDFTCVPLPWQPVDLQVEGRKLKWGVMWSDGICDPSPACKRALSTVVDALKKQGHEVVDFVPPSVPDLLTLGYQLVFSDGGDQLRSAPLPSEPLNAPLTATLALLALPRFVKRLLAWVADSPVVARVLGRMADPFYAGLLRVLHKKSVLEERELIVGRDDMRERWHERWTEEHLDFVLTVPHPLPALENGTGEKASLMSAGYTFLFNMLDYTAGVLPVTFVDAARDALPKEFMQSERFMGMNAIAKGAFSVYDADKMHGLPLGVQIAGRRMEEEKVLAGMKVVEAALRDAGAPFVPKVLV
ncbi:amidase signature domain-containing protein [Mycena epipterygia]|nr:amidase signature domain-containing protein [Mycena epipterygia]